ncbi:YhdP family protein [Aliarcobacter butzleri]
MFSSLYIGIKIDSFSFSNFLISQFYIKMDKKLILSIEKVEYKSESSKESNSLENLKNDIQLLPKILKFFQSIKIESLKINENQFYIWFNGKELYLDNNFINISSKINDSSNTVFFELNSLYLKDYKVLFDGKAKIDYFSKELNFFGNLYFENFQTALNIDITSKKIKFYLESKYFENLKFLKEHLDLPQEANEWMYDNVTGDFKLDWLYGEYDLKKNELVQNSIEGKAHIKDGKIRFHKDVDEIFTKSIDVTYKDDNLHFNLIEPKFKDKNIEGSFVTIHNLTDEINGNVEVNIKTNSKLDDNILGILKAYEINLPVKQKSGITNANLVLNFPYALDKPMSTKGEFLVDNSLISIDNFSFFSKKAKVTLDENIVYISDASFLYEDMIDANANLSIDTNTLKSTGTVYINSLIVKDDDGAAVLEIKDKNSLIDMDFSSLTTINLKDLDTKIKVDKSIFIDIANISKIYPYSKLFQTYAIKDGNISLEIKNENEINFNAFLKNINLPIKKDEKEINSIDLKGTIKDKNIEIFALNDDIKLVINDKTNLYLKDLKLFIDTKMSTKDLKENINLYLDNCELNLDNKDYKIKDANVVIENGDINFEATIKDLDIPLKKDGKTLEEIQLIGNYKSDDLKIYTKNQDLILFLDKDNLSLYLEEYDVSYYTEDEESISKYKKIDIIGKNSNIVINDEFEIVSDNYELRVRPDNKFAYIKYGDTQVVFRDTNGKLELYAVDISADFLNKISNRSIFLGGKVHFFATGNINDLHGKVVLKNSSIANLSILNNILLFIQTSPAIINPFLAIPSVVGLATNPGFNLLTYKISDGDLEFNYSKDKGLINIVKLNTVGNGIDFEGKGDIDLTNSNINFNMNLIFFKDYANIVGAIPVLNYIILGDENRVETKININGSLDNPTIATNLTTDTFNIPSNIVKRVINSPVRFFDNINNLEKEDSKIIIMK